VAVMSVGPLLSYGKDAARSLCRGLIVPGIAGGGAVATAMVFGMTNPWALICTGITAVAVFSVGVGLNRTVKQRRKIEEQGPMTSILRAIDANHRRYGGQFVHMGVVMLMVGVAGSSLFGIKQTFQLAPGESADFNGYTITFGELHQSRHANYTAVEAHVTLTQTDESKSGGGTEQTLHPQMRFYDKAEQPSAQVALNSTLSSDTYMTLVGWENDGQLVALQVIINPLVAWVWIGGIVMTLGAIFCLMPRLLRETMSAHAPVRTKTKHAATVPLALAGEDRCLSHSHHNPSNLSVEALK